MKARGWKAPNLPTTGEEVNELALIAVAVWWTAKRNITAFVGTPFQPEGGEG